uniref:NADH dehydrogenase subunit 3 n=1 Tax=Chimarra paramonorum TaxID=2484723 RepID=UPI0022DCDD6F|nr:NADH dehydrogenase subunit 3 [Chimarra paramonorum]UZZ43850.1 NADH dehydrogenase subunit 3 [Chimarra paramonorum]
MFYITLMILFLSLISNLVMLIAVNLSKKKIFDREKNSPFECGFNPMFYTRMPFSLHFFMITILFLIFDVEITILLPLYITFQMNNLSNMIFIHSFFLMILILGLYHEWKQNILNWSM